MRQPDEQRSQELLRRQRTQEATSDPERLPEKFEGMLARERKAKRKERQQEARIKQLEQEVKAARKRQDDDLKRRLAAAHGALDAYRAESKRLKEDLHRVRSSNSMRVGKALLSPLHAAKRLGGARPAVEEDRSNAVSAPNTAEHSIDRAPQRPGASHTRSRGVESVKGVDSHLPVSERTLETLKAEFEMERTPERFRRVVNRLWYNHGAIKTPADFIFENQDLVTGLAPKDVILVQRVLGEDRLRKNGITVPARAAGIAYVPEPGRVMYCVHSTPVFNSNGYSTRTRGVAQGLRDAGADVAVVSRPGYPWDSSVDKPKPALERSESNMNEIPYVHLPGMSLNTSPIDKYFIAAADAFAREARRQRPSVIQSASNHRTALPALLAARRLGVPFLYEVRGLWEVTTASQKTGWENTEQYASMVSLETLVASEADVVLAITQQIADELVLRGIDRSKIRVAPNAVDTEEFAPLPKDAAYAASRGIRTDVPVLGFAGSMVPYEGLSTLLEASAILQNRGVDHQVVLAGSGSAERELKAQRDSLKLSTTRFLGRLPIDEMPRLLSTFDIMPIPRESTPVTELVSPLKPLEAFSAMKAVVMSDVAPHIDLVGTNAERGLLFTAGNSESLADALQKFIDDHDLALNASRAARLWVFDQRQWRHIGAAMHEAHLEAISAYSDATPADGRRLETIRVGLIADEFTTSTLAATVDVVPLSREGWRAQLAQDDLDLVFVESAWEGNGGEWHRAVGHYGAEESADITALLTAARERGIPSVFWNKEDPVHFNRFQRTAGLCDHVFTTDANVIPDYLETPDAVSKTVSSLSFYAQPRIHNPLPAARAYQHSVAYAGTYYGERYAERSKKLFKMLQTAQPFSLTIYDRQATNPDSPYKFPREFADDVAGSLPYDEVIDSYKTHLAQLNGNSVEDSPTMFSRRVVEIAACGGIVLSSSSRALSETFGGTIAATDDANEWRAMLYDWARNPTERVRESWLQLRSVYRAHTAETAIGMLVRTAGVPVTLNLLPDYAALLRRVDAEVLDSIMNQSVRPSMVIVNDDARGAVHDVLGPHGIRVEGLTTSPADTAAWVAEVSSPVARTHFEDLLTATRFGNWHRVTWSYANEETQGQTLASPSPGPVDKPGLVKTQMVAEWGELDGALHGTDERTVQLLFAPPAVLGGGVPEATASVSGETGPKVIVVAGHDLKFAGGLIDAFKDAGHEVLIDQWHGHNQHDEDQSRQLLEQADIVFAEWGLGNAVWYSKNLQSHQRMVVRVHLQELQLPYLRAIKHSAVNDYLFVGELIRLAGVESHGVPASKARVVPNFVDVEALNREKSEEARFNIGLVGLVPQRKRVDVAVDLLERLLAQDSRYRLFIKGKRPEEYQWMKSRTDEMAFYEHVYSRIDLVNESYPGAVTFEAHGDDMAAWYQKIGVAISVSDFESFHFTVADGAASGAVPASLAWAGAEYIYPREWLYADVESMAAGVLAAKGGRPGAREYIVDQFSRDSVTSSIVEIVLETPAASVLSS